MAFRAFIKTTSSVSGELKGESTDSQHTDWSVVVDFDYGADKDVSAGTGGAYLGPVQMGNVSVTMHMDKSFPLYAQAMCENHDLEVELHFDETSGKDPFHVIELSHARVAHLLVTGATGGGDARPSVQVGFHYQQIKYQVTPFVDGEPDAPSEFVWISSESTSG